jgi:hypothetical protein
MRHALVIAVAALSLATRVPAQASPTQASQSPPAPEIYQIDLVPAGTGFALTKPVLEGDVFVFQAWPDRVTVRLPMSKVKKMVPRTNEMNKNPVWQIDLAPTGQMFSRDNPELKGTSYQFHRWSGGALMSVRQADVKKITRLSGPEALKIYLQHFGAKPIANLPMEGGTVSGGLPAAAAPQGSAPGGYSGPVNWIYEGTPGADDAWGPPNAVVSQPGDVPKAPGTQPR